MKPDKQWDIDFVRKQFPAFEDSSVRGTAFFENAGGTYVPRQVTTHLENFLIRNKVQPYGPYKSSIEGTRFIEQATVKMAELVNADEDEVVIGHCTTMNLFMLSMALRKQFKAGDEIIVTQQDHESNISPWLRLQEWGINVRFWPIDPATGKLRLDDLDELINERTRLLCMTHSSNIVGDVNDVKSCADKVHTAGGWILVDGVSYAPHHEIDVKALGVDIYVLSLYKLFAPHLGLMYVDRELHPLLQNLSLQQMPALYSAYTNPGSPNFLRIALNPGLVNHEEVASLLGLVEYFEDLNRHHGFSERISFHEKVKNVMELAGEYEARLSEQWVNWVEKNSGLVLVGEMKADAHQRSPTWSFLPTNGTPREIASYLAEQDIAVQSGSFYAWRCLESLNISPSSGVLRVSFSHFNTEGEIDRLCNSLDRWAQQTTGLNNNDA